MKLPNRLTDPATLGLIAATSVLYLLFARFEVFEWFYTYSRDHEDWELDEVFTFLFIAALTIPAILWRWNRQLARINRDIREAREEAQHHALHDPLTGLHNRRYFYLIADSKTQGGWADEGATAMSVLLIDLDRFKPINDLRGHEAGDALLREVARRLRDVCGDGDYPVRLGGDEFAILLTLPTSADSSSRMARRVKAVIEQPCLLDGWQATISCSIGISSWAEGLTTTDLLRNADQAMYRAKALGRGTYVHFDEDLGASIRDQASLETDLRQAIEDGQIRPYFQPIHDIDTGVLSGFEVLARWNHPTRGFVPPDRFIPLVEDMGLISKLSDTLLDESCAALAQWDTNLRLSFNLSPLQFGDLSLPARLTAILRRHGLASTRLEIEITERAVVSDMATARKITEELSALGISIAMDDFGTGMSSLATLSQLPFSKIKIDRSFIANIESSPTNAKIVTGVLALAASLSLDVTAEGIETDAELDFLRGQNCKLGQGYLFSRPQPVSDFARHFAAEQPPQEERKSG